MNGNHFTERGPEMTQDEQYRVIGQTFSNYQAATKQLACLKVKSKEAAEQLEPHGPLPPL